MKLYLVSYTDEASSETTKKRRQRLKKKLWDYYGEKILVLQTHTGIPDLIINVSHLSDQFMMKDDDVDCYYYYY